MPSTLTRKITVTGINNIKNGFESPKERTFVARIYGHASLMQQGQTQFGPYFKFAGQFKAVSMDGQEHFGNWLIVPEPAQGMLAAALSSRETSQGSVGFGFDIFIVPDDRTKYGYSFEVMSLVEYEDNAISKLEKLLAPVPAIAYIKHEKKGAVT